MNPIIESIKQTIRARNYPESKRLLDELEKDLEGLENLQEFATEVKKIVRNLGRSNMVSASTLEALMGRFKII